MVDSTRAAAFATPVFLVGAPAGVNNVNNYAAAGSHLLKTGAGQLNAININTGGAGSDVKVYDGLDASGTLLGTFSTAAQGVLPVNLPFTVGLFVVLENGTPANVTFVWQ